MSKPWQVTDDASSFIRTITVGSGIKPDLLTLTLNTVQALAGLSATLIKSHKLTAGGELHPALKTYDKDKFILSKSYCQPL
jgi:hypothetical protein